MQRNSRQRSAILSYLRSVNTHPTAETVYEQVRQSIPGISLGTVYRNLTNLAEEGTVRRLHISGGADHFDATVKPHYHFYCQCCRSVADLPIEPLTDLNRLAAAGFDGRIDGHEVTFYGTCAACLAKNKQ